MDEINGDFCAFHSRSASASSNEFKVSSTVPRKTRSRCPLIRSSSIRLTLLKGTRDRRTLCRHGGFHLLALRLILQLPEKPESGPPALFNCAKIAVGHLRQCHRTCRSPAGGVDLDCPIATWGMSV